MNKTEQNLIKEMSKKLIDLAYQNKMITELESTTAKKRLKVENDIKNEKSK